MFPKWSPYQPQPSPGCQVSTFAKSQHKTRTFSDEAFASGGEASERLSAMAMTCHTYSQVCCCELMAQGHVGHGACNCMQHSAKQCSCRRPRIIPAGEPGPRDPTAEVFLAFARVFSGVLRDGQTVHVLSAAYNPTQPDQERQEVQVLLPKASSCPLPFSHRHLACWELVCWSCAASVPGQL